MSPDLIAFLKAWHEWATNGAGPSRFDRRYGLCVNVYRFAGYSSAGDRLCSELSRMFDGESTPFGFDDYWSDAGNATMHLCPKRLAWVRERLIEAGELVA